MCFMGLMFINFVCTFYAISQHFIGNSDYNGIALINELNLQVFFLIPTLLLICTVNRVSNEVDNILNISEKSISKILNNFQGKRTFQIIHDIINNCNDSDTDSMV